MGTAMQSVYITIPILVMMLEFFAQLELDLAQEMQKLEEAYAARKRPIFDKRAKIAANIPQVNSILMYNCIRMVVIGRIWLSLDGWRRRRCGSSCSSGTGSS